MGTSQLTVRQESFVQKYLECGNASEAYRCAYPRSLEWKDKSVWEKASLLLRNDKVRHRVGELQAITCKNVEITKERILEELSAIIDSKITDYVELKYGELHFKDFDELTDRQIRAVESVKRSKYGIELKIHGKAWTIERVCKMLGFDKPEGINLTIQDPFGSIDSAEVIRILGQKE